MTEEERRHFERLKKPFVLSYQEADNPGAGYDISQVKDISLGGMHFTTAKSYAKDTILFIELRVPFMEERVKLKASVIESAEVTKNLIYNTRVKFLNLGKEEEQFLTKTVNLFLKKE